MTDIIILLIVAVIIGFALKGSIKHFKGEGQRLRRRRKRSDSGKGKKGPGAYMTRWGRSYFILKECTVIIRRRSVVRALNQIEGVSAEVNLKKKQAVVSYDRPVDERRLEQAVEHVGYTVSSVEKR